MKSISTMGELIIDFVPYDENQQGVYEQKLGGAPANVATVVAILGGDATFYGQVGDDVFGTFLLDELSRHGVNTKHVLKTKEAKTGLAFVSLDKKGNRSFHFYRNPSADMLYRKEDYIEDSDTEDIFAFSSVSLIDYPIKDAHLEAIQKIRQAGGMLVFDTNIRTHLWDDHDAYRELIFMFIAVSDIVKIADDEIFWLTQTNNLKDAIQTLKAKGAHTILFTKGEQGASIYLEQRELDVPGYQVLTVDTTGAGDAFLGAFLYQLAKNETEFTDMTDLELERILQFSNAVAAISTTKKGAVEGIPTIEEVSEFLKNH